MSNNSTNLEFTRDQVFRKACELAHVQPTKRQASKYRSGRGSAFNYKRQATEEVHGADE